MDYYNMTAPCGIACFECVAFKAKSDIDIRNALSNRTGISLDEAQCDGCRPNEGKCFLFKKNNIFPKGNCMLFANDDGGCKIYSCTQSKKIHNCSECNNFPCNNLHPLPDKTNIFPQKSNI